MLIYSSKALNTQSMDRPVSGDNVWAFPFVLLESMSPWDLPEPALGRSWVALDKTSVLPVAFSPYRE